MLYGNDVFNYAEVRREIMSELDAIRGLAEQALTIRTPAGLRDSFLWDRGQRLVCNVELICQLPELTAANLQIDNFSLTAAAYFSDSGMVRWFNSPQKEFNGQTSDENGDHFLDLSADVVAEKLDGVVESRKIKKIARIITESGNRFSRRVESMILSDARNLDDLGAVGIVNEFRQYIVSGKSVRDALGIWQRKMDYGYWQARLKEGFRFESVRKIAEQRLSTTESFMEQLKVESVGQDLQ